ncbi:ABC transporter substrate-binding protein [Hydrogenoanaerobacterium sp.]|uniref:ABC transporter substrate-binding protein n=1 Tax=Hydrogenoanaerobacterium sp. TaxID=2953763 RepID=UPI00289780A2|nr:ABC transporter substrate-binding protein [Hydrogenoanaerobacterium sp.]
MKKVLSVILAVIMASMVFSGCGAAPSTSISPEANTGSAPIEAGKKLKIGIVQIVEHPSLNTIRESFLEELKALGYGEDKVEIDYQNAQGDQSTLNSITQKFVTDKSDLIVAIATPSAQSAAAATKDIPVLFSAVTDPLAANLMTDLSKPNGNATGTSDAIPVDQIFELSKKLTPNVKKYGFLYCTSEVSAISVINEAKKYCDENGIAYTEASITNTSELQQAAQSLVGQCDAFYTTIDNVVASAMPVLADVALQAKMPVYVGADSMVMDGGFATVGIEYTNLGKQTAAMADKILSGTPISEIPVETLNNFGTIINEDTAAELGITIPEDIKATAQIVKTSTAK